MPAVHPTLVHAGVPEVRSPAAARYDRAALAPLLSRPMLDITGLSQSANTTPAAWATALLSSLGLHVNVHELSASAGETDVRFFSRNGGRTQRLWLPGFDDQNQARTLIDFAQALRGTQPIHIPDGVRQGFSNRDMGSFMQAGLSDHTQNHASRRSTICRCSTSWTSPERATGGSTRGPRRS